jgi:hypothetical protein
VKYAELSPELDNLSFKSTLSLAGLLELGLESLACESELLECVPHEHLGLFHLLDPSTESLILPFDTVHSLLELAFEGIGPSSRKGSSVNRRCVSCRWAALAGLAAWEPVGCSIGWCNNAVFLRTDTL